MKILITLILSHSQFLYGQKMHRTTLPAEHFISFKLLKFNTQINNAKDFDFTAEIKNISKRILNFYRLSNWNCEYEVHKCLTQDSTTISDTCISMSGDPIFSAEEDLKPVKYFPNESFTWSRTLLNPCTTRTGLYKVRFIVKVGDHNPLLDNYYTKWYYIAVNKDLSEELK